MIIIPTVEFLQQSLSTDPSGSRHLKSSAAGYIKTLDTSAIGVLDLGSVNTANSGVMSETKLAYARVNNFGNASGIFNMRLFVQSSSAFTEGNYRFIRRQSLHFLSNLILTENNQDLSTTVPTQANVSGTSVFAAWQDGCTYISGIFDQDVTMYQYLAAFIGNDVNIGQKGGPGAGSFRYRLIYDFA